MRKATIRALDGAALQSALALSASWLEARAEAVNALNVFPVPDGDTGLNMSLTLRSAADEAAGATPRALPAVASAMARGGLMGARGNSGVILAQMLRGMSQILAGASEAGPRELAHALTAGADAAYEALTDPVEGTILTVARCAAQAAEERAGKGDDLAAVLGGALEAATAAVATTPDLLPILKQAGVVDAGGEGYRIFLEGLLMHVRRESLPEIPPEVTAWADLSALHQGADDFYGYCTEVLFQGAELDSRAVRHRLEELGTSVLVVGDARLLKVHVHTLRPGAVLDLATDLGEIVKVKIDNMQLQHQQFARAAPEGAARPREPGTGLVAVACGDGLEKIFTSLGAIVVRGGQTMNPSVGDLRAAIERVPREQVIVLPNNSNVVLTAEEAARLDGERTVLVVPTQNVAQGIAAAVALNPASEADANVPALQHAVDRCQCLQLTRAVRRASIEGLAIRAGDFLALLNGRPVATGPAAEEAVSEGLAHLPRGPYEIATIYVGDAGTHEGAEALAGHLRSQLGVPDVDVQPGGQPHYPYVIAVE